MINNYFLDSTEMSEEVKIWSQMFFDDGSLTQGRYITRYTYDDIDAIKREAINFLNATNRIEGVLLLWGAGKIMARKARITKKGLRLTRI